MAVDGSTSPRPMPPVISRRIPFALSPCRLPRPLSTYFLFSFFFLSLINPHSSIHSLTITMQEVLAFVRSYVVPEGFPDSVTPSYVPYMTWRALKVLLFPSSSTNAQSFDAFLISNPFFLAALFWWSNGRFHHSDPLEFSWCFQKQGYSWGCRHQLDSQGNNYHSNHSQLHSLLFG